ncbi:GNAT family N-acetyltransferase [Marinilactibacillus kalidii]|uniref:GNAT family N-acetyltransferase n=1 Tax=Marinilactibacillus kalidii TaxID=2820274 RepID=UPI001ABED1AF|nr:GNAT family N-acetyltransferase [Marinilactibacillus kalidii]
MTITYKETKVIEVEKVKALYQDVGWVAYTEDDNIITAIIPNALQVISAWDGDELIGLVRTVGDGVYIMYIQDILVKESHQGKGVGSQLLQKLLESNKHIRQNVLLTEDTEKTIQFYEKNGFMKADGKEAGIAFVKYGG